MWENLFWPETILVKLRTDVEVHEHVDCRTRVETVDVTEIVVGERCLLETTLREFASTIKIANPSGEKDCGWAATMFFSPCAMECADHLKMLR